MPVADLPAPPTPADPAGTVAAPARFHIASLDGIRAVAIAVVFLSHGGLGQVVPGILGVTVFFFLSGYLITTLLRLELDRTGGVRFGQFYLRRALRIFPPLYAYLLVLVGLRVAGLIPSFRWDALGAEALHLSNVYLIRHGGGAMPAGSDVLWSLAIEEHFYLLFPLLYVWLRRAVPRPGGQAACFLFGCAAVLAWRCWLTWASPDTGYRSLRIAHGTDTRIDSLLFGCAMAVWRNPAVDPPGTSDRQLKVVWVPLGLAVLLATLLVRGPDFRDSIRFTLQGLALWPLFVAAVRLPRWSPFAVLNWRPAIAVGGLSYTAYLVHDTVLKVLAGHAPGPARLAVGAAVTLAVAAASYVAVERPCARLRRRLGATAA